MLYATFKTQEDGRAMKLLSSTMIWRGDIFSLYSDQVLLDHGVSAQRDLIRHPGGAAILLMRDEHILLVRQYRHGAGRALLEIPAGKLESGESPDCCARRELEEEAGFRCDALRHLCSVYPSPGICSELLHLYGGHFSHAASRSAPDGS